MSSFSTVGVFLRFFFALILVFTTYNPSTYSYVGWIVNFTDGSLPLLLLSGVVLVIGWLIFLRATLRSLGPVGISLAIAFFACLVWLAVDFNLIEVASNIFIYVVLVVIAAILSVGMSWSHIRRRLSGQVDTDDVDN